MIINHAIDMAREDLTEAFIRSHFGGHLDDGRSDVLTPLSQRGPPGPADGWNYGGHRPPPLYVWHSLYALRLF